MEQQQSDIRELLQLYNSAVDLKKRAEKKLIRFTNSLKEVDRKNCGNEIIHEINVVRSKIKADRQQQAEQTVRNTYAQLQNQMTESTTSLKHQLQAKELCNKFSYSKELEQLELNYKCQIQQQQQVINELKLQYEEIRDNNEEQILSLTEKNQQLITLIEDLNKQIAELKSALEQYQNEEFKFLNNSSQLRVSQPLEVVKKRNATADSMEQCQFDTLASEMRYEENSNYDREILLGSSNKELEDPQCEIDETITQLKLEVQTLQEDKERLLNQLQEKVQLQNQVDSLSEIIARNEENFTLQLQTIQNSNQLLEKQSNDQLIQIQDNKNQLEQLQLQQNESIQTIEQLKRENQLMTLEKEQLINLIETKDKKIASIQESNEQLDQDLKQKLSEIGTLTSDLQQLRQQNNEQAEEAQKAQIEINTLKAQIVVQEENHEETKKQNEAQLQEIQKLQQSQILFGQEKDQLLQSLSELQKIFAEAQLENQKLQEEKKEQLLKYNEKQHDHDALLVKNQEIKSELELFREQILEEQQNLTEQIKNLESKNTTFEQSNQQLQNQIKTLEEQLQETQNQTNNNLVLHEGVVSQYQTEKEQHEQQINQLANRVEDLLLSCDNKDDKINLLEQELELAHNTQDEKCHKLTEQYEEQLRQMQDQLGKSVENIRQHSETSSPVKDDKFKDQINRLNDELRRSQLQIASLSTINTQLKQQLKEIVIKLQILLKIQPNDHQDLNELVRLIETNLSSCQSSPVKPIKKTSMNDATKLFLNKARSSVGSVRIPQRQQNDGRRSHQFQTPSSNSAVEFDQILNDSDI